MIVIFHSYVSLPEGTFGGFHIGNSNLNRLLLAGSISGKLHDMGWLKNSSYDSYDQFYLP